MALSRSRKRLFTTAVVLGGIVLLVLGIDLLRKLMVGSVPPQMLNRIIGATVSSLGIGFAIIIWGLVDGISRTRQDRIPVTPQEIDYEESDPPPGIEFVFETGEKLVEKQWDSINRLDTKAGILWGFLGASIIGTLNGVYSGKLGIAPGIFLYIFCIGIGSFSLGIIFALATYLPQPISWHVNYQELVRAATSQTNVIKHHFVAGVLEAYNFNRERSAIKARRLTIAFIFGTIGFIFTAVSLVSMKLLSTSVSTST